MKRTFLLAVIIINGMSACSQTDTTFWFAAPDISSDFGYDHPIMLRLTAYAQPAVVTVSQPAGGGMPPQMITLAANTTLSIDLTPWLSNIECGPGNIIQNKGLKISSTTAISAYYEVNVGGPNPELFALKGRNALGNQFFISSQYFLSNSSSYTPRPYSSFNIVATEDNALVTITPTQNIIGHTANVAFTITLNKGQTYAAIATSQAASAHLQGSSVSSTKPVAVTLSDDLLAGAEYGGICADMIGDQTVPFSITGSEYIAFKSSLNTPFDKVYITATQNGTIVTKDGAVVTVLSAGQTVQLTISTPVTYIQTSQPAYAYHLAGNGCEVGSAILPKIGCTGSTSVSVTRSTNETFAVTLLVRNGGQGGFLVNGSAGIITSGNFNVVPGTGGQWYYAKVTLSPGTYPNGTVIRISNSISVFQEGVLQGDVSGVSYGYFSDYNSLQANATTSTPSVCEGSAIQFSADSIASASYSWTGPNGYASNTRNNSIPMAAVINSGDYIVTVTVPACGTYLDTVNILVKPKVFTTIDTTICQGQSYAGYNSAGTYIDVFTGSNGCDSTRTLNLAVTPGVTTSITATICEGQVLDGHNSSGTYVDVFTGSNGCDSTRTLILTVIPSKITSVNATICEGQFYFAGGANQTNSGIYRDTLIAQSGCDSIIITNLLVNPKPNPDLGPDRNLCIGITTILNPGSFATYSWQDMSTLPTFTATGIGKYWVTVTDNNCTATDTLLIKGFAAPPSDFLKPVDSICQYGTLTIYPLHSYQNYLWSTGSIRSYITIDTPGLYTLMVKDIDGCSGIDSTRIFLKKCMTGVFIPTAFTPNNDMRNDVFRAMIYGSAVYFRLEVYNRYGELVFLTTDPLKGWDGNYKGVTQNPAVFTWQCFYQLTGESPGYQKGILTLIR